MKLKKTEASESEVTSPTASTGSAVIADRFKLDVAPTVPAASAVNRTATLIAFLAALAAAACVGAVAAMMYVNWGLIANA